MKKVAWLIGFAAVPVAVIIWPALDVCLRFSGDCPAQVAAWGELRNAIAWAALKVATIGALFSLVAISTPWILAWFSKPKLDIEIGQPTGEHKPWRFLHLMIYNRPIRGLLGSIIRRDAAAGCKVKLRFSNSQTNKDQFKPILARWSAQPEPLRFYIENSVPKTSVETPLVVIGQTFSLDANEEGSDVAVAVKHEGDESAFAFNSYSYFHPKWANPDWELPQGEYLVQATVMSGQLSFTKTFMLINMGKHFRNFRLEPFSSK